MQVLITTILMVSHLNLQLYTQPDFVNDTFEQPYFETEANGVEDAEFELVGGLIFVEAELNGKKEKFILDTGAPHLLLNTDKHQPKQPTFLMNGIGGSKGAYAARNIDFDWNGVTAKREESYSVDLENIARAKGRDFAGLISYDQVKRHEVVIDYERKRLFLVSKKNKEFFQNHEKVDKVWFRMIGHMPVVKVKIGKRRYYFGIDTGAEVNVIDQRLKNKIPEALIEHTYVTSILGGNEEKVTARTTQLKSIKVGKSNYKDMSFAYADLSFMSQEPGKSIDGLLGYPFLSKANFSINYRKKQLCKWEPKPQEVDPDVQLATTENNTVTKSPSHHTERNIAPQD